MDGSRIPDTRLRMYRAEDWRAVRDLFISINSELAPPNLVEAFDAYVAAALETEIDQIPEYYSARSGSFWIAEDRNGNLIGMYGLEQAGPKTAELRRMYVAQTFRRQGLASKMLDHAERTARRSGYQTMILSTSSLQAPAIALYRAVGYRLTSEERSTTASHKSIGAGVKRYHFEKTL